MLLGLSSPTDAGLCVSYVWENRRVTEPSERVGPAPRATLLYDVQRDLSQAVLPSSGLPLVVVGRDWLLCVGRVETFSGHQNHRPSRAAIEGVMRERTMRVSKRRPRPMVVPPWPMLRRSLETMAAMVKANTRPAAVTTLPVLPMERMMPVLMPEPISSLKRETRSRLYIGTTTTV